MAEMYDTSCSSHLPSRSALEADDISLFLQHLLHSSSSSSSSSCISERPKHMPFSAPPPQPSPLFSLSPQFKTLPDDQHRRYRSTPLSDSDCRVRDGTSASTPESSAALDSSALILSSSGIYFPAEMKDTGIASSVGTGGDCDAVTVSAKRRKLLAENDFDDYDCESEEGLEVSEGPSKSVPPHTSSKRSRAAEVHNLSEKRRRSRINEKMKALQSLIPNSNKTDKASMLDEAIEYLKQLQLQVQMLSMRNGMSLHASYLPGVLQPLQLPQMQTGICEGNGLPLHMNVGTSTLPVNQESSTRTSFGLSNQCTTSHQAIVIDSIRSITNAETSFGLDSPIQVPQGPFQLSTASEEIYREDVLPQQQLDTGHSARNPSASRPFDARASVLENINGVEPCVLHRKRPEDMLSKDVDGNQFLIQYLHGQEMYHKPDRKKFAQ